ncbi:endoribonuclease MazF [Microvirga antarctica]|uniref:endoribonuclease MazF n=1 Tax=Microvirga antarctica TaxID=2819233 RepID=UPI001B3015D4|nr:endoribonuclease MazF [Microvirga antarctica]
MSSSSAYCPDAGDLIWLTFNPQAGREQNGRRPALVLSPRSYNALSRLCVLCPITNQGKGYPFEVPLPTGASVTGFVLSDQVKSLSWVDRDAAFIATAPAPVVSHARAKIKALLQIA